MSRSRRKAVYGFNDRQTAESLSELGRQIGKRTQSGMAAHQVAGRGFVIQTEAGGIPARTEADDNGDTIYTAGQAECFLWQINRDGEFSQRNDVSDPAADPLPFKKITVYNLFDQAAPGDTFLPATQLSGRICVMLGGGGAGARIFKTPQGGIPSRDKSTDEVFFATCNEYEIAPDGGSWKLEEVTPTIQESVFNPFAGDVCEDVVILATQIDGRWVIEAEECDCEDDTGPVNP